jgi:hypothetical protein
MRIHTFQHASFERLGTIEPRAASHGHVLSTTLLYASDPNGLLDRLASL